MTYQANAVGSTPGIQGDTTINTANGVKGTSSAGASAIYGTITGSGAAVHGFASGGYDNSWAVYAQNNNTRGYGVYAIGNGNQGIGVYGIAYNYGIFGNGFIGVYALTNSYNGNALWVDGSASSSAGAAAVFIGEVRVNGNFTATTKSVLIDHPADPANRYLEHACVESSERKTLYDGVGVADASGVLEVALPTYFEALNRDVRYLLTPIGAPAPNLHVREEVKAGRFVIAGAAAGQKICWCVTGVRNDAYAVAHPLAVERDKSAEEKGLYLNPIEHGQPADRGVHHAIAKQARERAAQAPNVPEQPT